MNVLGLCAAITGFMAVALGAFGAHALDNVLTAQGKEWWQTATIYALPHSAAAFAIAFHGKTGLLRLGAWLLLAGTAIFAGTLYLMALGLPAWLGAVTPLGGTSLLAGWGFCAAAALRS